MSEPTVPLQQQEQPEQQAEQQPESSAWTISFATTKKRKITKKEKTAMEHNAPTNRIARLRQQQQEDEEANKKKSSSGGADSNSEVDESPTTATTDNVVVNVEIDLEVAIPRNLQTTQEDIKLRNHFDLQRFYCMVKQYKATCGMSSLCSVWNHLYSRLGAGALPPVSQEEMMSILGFHPPFGEIRWGPFTGNTTLIRWFHAINKHFGVSGKAYYMYKAHGYGRTVGLTSEDGKQRLKEALLNPCAGVIYHCKNHYMVPIGFKEEPKAQVDAYAQTVSPADIDTHIIVGEVSRGKHSPMHVVKWDHIATDIECQAPYFFNIRQREKGVQKREKCKRPGGNLHCLMCFRSDMVEENLAMFEEGGGCEEEEEQSSGDEKAMTPTAAE